LWDRLEFSEKANDRSASVVVECKHVDQVGEAGGLIGCVIQESGSHRVAVLLVLDEHPPDRVTRWCVEPSEHIAKLGVIHAQEHRMSGEASGGAFVLLAGLVLEPRVSRIGTRRQPSGPDDLEAHLA
jgi:hypothetical protein